MSSAGASPQALLQPGHGHAERRHRVADVVQHAARDLCGAGLERVIDQPAARILELVDHLVELAREHPELVPASERETHREVVMLGDPHGVPRHAAHRPEDHLAYREDQHQQHDDADDQQRPEREPRRGLALCGDRARHVDTQHQRTTPVDIDDLPVHLVRGGRGARCAS